MAWEKLDQTLTAAKKALGDDAEIPLETRAAVNKALHELNAAIDAMQTKRTDRVKKIFGLIGELEKKIVERQNLNSGLENALELAETALTTSTYRLNALDAGEKKKIEQAHTLFKNYFKDREREMDDSNKSGSKYNKDIEEFKNVLMNFK